MANTKPENRFIGRVHKKIPLVYSDKTNNPYKGGIPDVFYSGCEGDLWVEYKYIPALPKRANTQIIPDLSALQLQWLTRRKREGRNVAVIVGCPTGGVILTDEVTWVEGLRAQDFVARMHTTAEVSAWVHSQVGDSVWHLPE